jgi:hypothetical protein
MGLLLVRYGIGVVMVAAGIVLLVISPGGFGVDGFALAVGGGASVLLINFLFRLGASGDLERRSEEQARDYFAEHGEWPDEAPATQRKWTLAPGTVTQEQEQEQERERERQGTGP